MTFRRLVIAIAFLSILVMASRPMVDTDTWWHLRTGQWILDHRSILEVDRFSFTRYGEAYYYPAWLSEIFMTEAFSLGGLTILNLLFTGLIVLAYAMIFFTMKGDAFLTVVVLVLAAVVSEIYWSARPQLFTFLFGACFYLGIRKFLFDNKNYLWVFPPIMLLWVNIHPGFAVGFLLLLIAIAGQGVHYLAERPLRNPDAGKKTVWLIGTLLACLAAAIFNPRGPAVLKYPFETVSIQFLQKFILEWQSPDFHYLQAQLFLVLFLLAWTVIAFSPKALDAIDFLFLVVIGVMGFMANRNTYLLSIAAPAIIMRYGDPILHQVFPKWNPDHPVSRAESAFQFVIFGICAAVSALWIFATFPADMDALFRRQTPVQAVEYLAELPDDGRMFNSYNWGSYLVWALPSRPVFVDGRTDLYGDEILDQYLTVVDAREGWQDVLQSWDIRVVFLEPSEPIVPFLLWTGWTVGYRDSQAIVLLHPSP